MNSYPAVLITGSSRGIGRAAALSFAGRAIRYLLTAVPRGLHYMSSRRRYRIATAFPAT